jgi:hypothetical protein
MPDEKARAVANTIRDSDHDDDTHEGRAALARDILSKLSALDEGRVERAVAFIEAELPGVDRPDSAIAHWMLRQVRAILTAPTDSSAGSGGSVEAAHRETAVATASAGVKGTSTQPPEPGGRSTLGGHQLLCAVCDSPLRFDSHPDGFCHVMPCESHSPPPAERRVAWRCPKHFKGNALLPVGGAAPCEDCGQWCWFGSGGPEWTTDPKPEPPPAELEPNSNIGGDPTPDDLLARAKRWAERADRTAPAGSELADVAGAIHCVVTYLQGHGTAEVKPSERIAELALLYEAEGLSGPAAIAKATCDYLDEQHARGRK